jgi:hypothetical protein
MGNAIVASLFPRLKERFIYEQEHGERKLIMKAMLLLYNL